jgi:hypothetical protein
MTYTQIEMSEDEFDAQYPLLTNHLNPHATWAYGDDRGCLFETHGEELEFVRQQDPTTVWTILDGDDGDQYLVNGFHFVNRIGYLISTVAIPEGVDIEVRIPMQAPPSDESGEQETGMIQRDQPIGTCVLSGDKNAEPTGVPTADPVPATKPCPLLVPKCTSLAPNGFSACFCKGCGSTLSPDHAENSPENPAF